VGGGGEGGVCACVGGYVCVGVCVCVCERERERERERAREGERERQREREREREVSENCVRGTETKLKNTDARSQTHNIHTGWRRLIGSPKLQVIFHRRATKYRSLLRKMTYKDKGSYESSPSVYRCTLANTQHTYAYTYTCKIIGLFCKI